MSRPVVFSIVAIPIYTLAYYLNWPLFLYYPAIARFSLVSQARAGFVILWYGWIATAIVIGFLAAVVLPRRWLLRLSPDLAWILLVAAVLAALVYEKRWFI